MSKAPMLLTFGNGLLGASAIVLVFLGHPWPGGLLLLLAALLDAYDGRLARKLGVDSHGGAVADSLADLVSFATAPAVFLYMVIGGPWGLVVAVVFALFIAGRLLRYLLDPPPAGSYIGLPSPSAALPTTAAALIALREGWPVFAAVAALFFGLLAISRFQFPGWGHPAMKLLPKAVRAIIWIGLLVLFFLRPAEAVLAFFTLYLILGPFLLIRFHAALAEEAVGEGGAVP